MYSNDMGKEEETQVTVVVLMFVLCLCCVMMGILGWGYEPVDSDSDSDSDSETGTGTGTVTTRTVNTNLDWDNNDIYSFNPNTGGSDGSDGDASRRLISRNNVQCGFQYASGMGLVRTIEGAKDGDAVAPSDCSRSSLDWFSR